MSREYRRTPASRRTAGDTSMQSGSSKSYYVFIIVGIILGLMLAIGVYYFINHAPTPFVNKSNQTVVPELGKVTLDPNQKQAEATQNQENNPVEQKPQGEGVPENQQNPAANNTTAPTASEGAQTVGANQQTASNTATSFEFYKILQDTDNPVQVEQPKPKPIVPPKQTNPAEEESSAPTTSKKEQKQEKIVVKENRSERETPDKEPPAAPAKVVEKSIPTAAVTKEIYFIQCGAFQSEKEANNLKARLGQLGLIATINTKTNEKGTLHRVRIGPYKHVEDLTQDRETLESNSIPQTLVKLKITDVH